MSILKMKTRTKPMNEINAERKWSKKYGIAVMVFTIFMYGQGLFAQDTVTGKLEDWGNEIKAILNTVVGIFAFVGGFLIFIQYMQGNEQAQKNFIRFVIGLAIFGLVALVANIFIPGSNVTNP